MCTKILNITDMLMHGLNTDRTKMVRYTFPDGLVLAVPNIEKHIKIRWDLWDALKG